MGSMVRCVSGLGSPPRLSQPPSADRGRFVLLVSNIAIFQRKIAING